MIRDAVPSEQKGVKALLVVPWEDRGGVVTVVENLARYLESQGHEVMFLRPGTAVFLKRTKTTFGFPGVELRLSIPGAKPRPFISALGFPLVFPLVLLQLIWFLRRRQIQVVNIHYAVDRFFYFAICRRLLPIRLVTSVHGGDAFSSGRPKAKYSRLFRLMLRCSDLIILPSDAYRRLLLEAFPGLKDKTIFIHNGINPRQFRPAEEGENRNGRERYLLCVAHLRDYKGIDILLRAATPLLTADRSLRLLLAGDGPLREELEDMALSLGIHNQTLFLGTKEATEIVSLLHDCEILVLPSREESFGIVLIEAMACKKPVVATAVGGIPEIVEHEKSGILVEPDNPEALTEGLRRVLRNSELKRVLAENGYSRVMEHFCFSRTGKAYEMALAAKRS